MRLIRVQLKPKAPVGSRWGTAASDLAHHDGADLPIAAGDGEQGGRCSFRGQAGGVAWL